MLFLIINYVCVCLLSGRVKGSSMTGMPTLLQFLSFRISDLASYTILSSAAVKKKKEQWHICAYFLS